MMYIKNLRILSTLSFEGTVSIIKGCQSEKEERISLKNQSVTFVLFIDFTGSDVSANQKN